MSRAVAARGGAARALVVGGGYAGVELAATLRTRLVRCASPSVSLFTNDVRSRASQTQKLHSPHSPELTLLYAVCDCCSQGPGAVIQLVVPRDDILVRHHSPAFLFSLLSWLPSRPQSPPAAHISEPPEPSRRLPPAAG